MNPRDNELEIYKKTLTAFRMWRGFETINDILRTFRSLDVYLAGGVLRDIVLGHKHDPKDFDFFIGGADVSTVLAYLENHGHLSLGPFGSPRWFPSLGDVVHCDIIPIERFYNGLWHCRDIVDVLNQFDFTGNAIAVDLRTGRFFNPQNGLRDLSDRIMRAVRLDYPDEPIAPNQTLTRMTVLWFRILHYTAKLGLTIEDVTLKWLRKNSYISRQIQAFEKTFFSLHPNALNSLGSDYDV